MEIENKIKEVLNRLRPYLQNDGGDVVFQRYENGVVYVKLTGACSNCPLIDNTLESGIEEAIINEIPEVIKVVNEDWYLLFFDYGFYLTNLFLECHNSF